MLDWSAESFKMPQPYKKVIISVHQDQLDQMNISHRTLEERLAQMLGRLSEHIFLVVQKHERKGAADSVLVAARPFVESSESVAIWNCDNFCWKWNRQLPPDADGWVLTFNEPTRNPKWSFASIGDDGYITRIAEKDPISDTATVGAYFFRRGRDLIWCIEEAIHQGDRTNGEFYMAPCYNYLIKNGRRILPVNVEEFEGLGTPEDVDAFVLNHRLPDWRVA
jgi:dTDP-glucose pyrophosphorylase